MEEIIALVHDVSGSLDLTGSHFLFLGLILSLHLRGASSTSVLSVINYEAYLDELKRVLFKTISRLCTLFRQTYDNVNIVRQALF